MIKKIFFIILGFFLFLFGILILIAFNINYFLNHPQIKNKLSKFLKENYKIELKYDKIKIDLSQQKVSIYKLFFKSSQHELISPRGDFLFSLSKLLNLKFSPKEAYLSNAYLKVYKTKKPFTLKDLTELFSKTYPFYLDLDNMTLDYESPLGWINFKELNLKLKVDKFQALYSVESQSDLFEKAYFKGRFNHKNLFSENSLSVENLNLSKFEKIADYGISKTFLNLKSEIVLEKETLNAAFVISNPYIFLKETPSEKILGGFLEGTLVSKKHHTEVTVYPLIINYPKIRGTLNVIKDDKGYEISMDAEELSFSDIKDILIKTFPQDKNIKNFFGVVRGGGFHRIKIEASGKEIKDIFKLKNLGIKGSIDEGQISVSRSSLDFENIKGEFSLDKEILVFKGDAIVNKNIPLQVKELSLDLKKEPFVLFVKGDFEGDAEELRNLIIQVTKNPQFLEKYTFKGDLKGKIELKGEITNLKGKVDLFFNNFVLQSSHYESPILLEKGTLTYDFNKVVFENLKLISDNSYVEDLTGELNLKNLDLEMVAKNVWISQKFLEELSKKKTALKDFISKYRISFEGIHVNHLKYKDNIKFLESGESLKLDQIEKNIFAEGWIKNLSFQISYKKETFPLRTKELSFEYDKGKIHFKSMIDVEDSSFELEGTFKEDQVLIEGTGELNKNLAKKLENFSEILSKFSIKTPVKFNKFKVFSDNKTLLYSGNHEISGINFNLSLNKNEGFFNFDLAVLSKASDLKLQIKEKNFQTSLKTEGKFGLEDLSKIFEDKKYAFAGKLETSLNFLIPKDFKFKDLKSLVDFYLNSNLILQDSYLKLDNFMYFYNGTPVFSTDLFGNFTNKNIEISKFIFKWNSYQIEGKFNVEKRKNYLYLSGDLLGKEGDLRKLIKEKKVSNQTLSFLDNIPFIAEIKFRMDSLILPTAHQLEDINGELRFNNKNKVLMLDVPQISFCNLNLQAIYERDLENQFIFIEILPSKGDFLDLFSCLYPEEMPEVILEGSYNLAGYFYGEGDKKKMIKKGAGELKINSNKGYIYRAPLLGRVFAYLSPIDLFRGKVPNLENNLLEYEELDFKSFVENATLKIDTCFLSAIGFRLFGEGEVAIPDGELNLTFYVSPFKTIDVIIEKIPYLGNLILGKPRMLVYLPLQVTGTYKNYSIIPLHPSSIGKGIFTFIFRVFGIPEEFFKKTPEFKELKKQKLMEMKEKVKEENEGIDKSS